MKEPTATLFNIQRFSLHDGPGIRTTVFFKGCNMKCAWCHNPESFSMKPQLSIDHNKCTLCMQCASVCKKNAHIFDNDHHKIDTASCMNCFACVNTCPNDALSVVGETWTLDDVIEACLKDIKYYKKDNGGVTFSGGEATLQFDFLLALAKSLKTKGIHTCLETNGALLKQKLSILSEYIDLFLFDFKLYDNVLHKKYIGLSNEIVYESLELLNKLQKSIVLRCPIIPGINDTDEHFNEIKRLHKTYDNIVEVELMPYHSVGRSKWSSLSMNYSLGTIQTPDEHLKKQWNQIIKETLKRKGEH